MAELTEKDKNKLKSVKIWLVGAIIFIFLHVMLIYLSSKKWIPDVSKVILWEFVGIIVVSILVTIFYALGKNMRGFGGRSKDDPIEPVSKRTAREIARNLAIYEKTDFNVVIDDMAFEVGDEGKPKTPIYLQKCFFDVAKEYGIIAINMLNPHDRHIISYVTSKQEVKEAVKKLVEYPEQEHRKITRTIMPDGSEKVIEESVPKYIIEQKKIEKSEEL